jgi:membrane protein DedA with SNARE-associated domain
VPPVAGALGIGATRAALAMGLASGAWYALVCWLAFRAGANADALLDRIAAQQRTLGLIALGLVGVAGVAYWLRRRRCA